MLILEWPSFSKNKFKDAIKKCNSSSTLELDYIFWWHLKFLIDDNKCLSNFVNITNACINFGFWPSHFKTSSLIIIPKPNKLIYNSLKIFQPIFLLNTPVKLIEKVIGERLQVQYISSNFIHPNQLGGLKQWSTTDTGLFLIHLICTR